MAITIGSVVGTAEITESNTLTVPLTGVVPATDPSATTYVLVAVCQKQRFDPDDRGDVDISDDSVPGAPYFGANSRQGIELGMLSIHSGQGEDYARIDFYCWRILNALDTSNSITISYPDSPWTMKWMGAKLHVVTGLDPDNPGFLGFASAPAQQSSWTIPFTPVDLPNYHYLDLTFFAGIKISESGTISWTSPVDGAGGSPFSESYVMTNNLGIDAFEDKKFAWSLQVYPVEIDADYNSITFGGGGGNAMCFGVFIAGPGIPVAPFSGVFLPPRKLN